MAESVWSRRAEEAQTKFHRLFWNPVTEVMDQWVPRGGIPGNQTYYYWWQAHVIDALVDGYLRSGDGRYAQAIEASLRGAVRKNNGTVIHDFYDDMEWLALALLRAYEATGLEVYKEYVLELWDDIKTAWNDHMGGGMAWQKKQLDYKNTPANAPASILASRLFRHFGRSEDLEWAKRIYHWNKDNLVDPMTGFVWDGMNRQGDGQIDKEWTFTYCQGVFIGAGVELYRTLGDAAYLEDAKRTAAAAQRRYVQPKTGMLPDEGNDDCGLFKGIYVRYVRELLKEAPEANELRRMIEVNSEALWEKGMSSSGLISRSWVNEPEPVVQLSAQLSGIFLLEMMASLALETSDVQ